MLLKKLFNCLFLKSQWCSVPQELQIQWFPFRAMNYFFYKIVIISLESRHSRVPCDLCNGWIGALSIRAGNSLVNTLHIISYLLQLGSVRFHTNNVALFSPIVGTNCNIISLPMCPTVQLFVYSEISNINNNKQQQQHSRCGTASPIGAWRRSTERTTERRSARHGLRRMERWF